MTTTINADNGVVSGSAGLKSSADSSGVLALQTNGTTAVTVGTDQSILMTGAPSIGGAGYGMGMGFRNRIINGAMVIDQRNAGASVTPSSGSSYTLDRWKVYASQASKFSVQQNAGSVTPPVGFVNYAGITSLSAYSVGTTDEFDFYQVIEGFNTADLNWGTANAKTVTLSFWVRSSLTGTFGGVIYNSGNTRNYPFSYSISSANTWTQISVTIAGDTTGTWLTTNGAGISVLFSLGAGSSALGTAGAWTATAVSGATGQTSVVGTNAATFYLTGVQLEKGSTATAFDYRPYGTELALCQRYYYKNVGAAGTSFYLETYSATGSYPMMRCQFPTVMRATPTVALIGTFSSGNCTTITLGNPSTLAVPVYATTNGTAQRTYFLNDANSGFDVTAEL